MTDDEPSSDSEATDVEGPSNVSKMKISLVNETKSTGNIISSDDDLTDVEPSSDSEATDVEGPSKVGPVRKTRSNSMPAHSRKSMEYVNSCDGDETDVDIPLKVTRKRKGKPMGMSSSNRKSRGEVDTSDGGTTEVETTSETDKRKSVDVQTAYKKPRRDLDFNGDNAANMEVEASSTVVNRRKCPGIRVKWSQAELDALRRHFKNLKKPPDEESIRQAVDRYPVLKTRTIPVIKSRAWHMIQTGR